MTGKEKIQAVVDIINENRHRIITGNVIEVSSATLSSKGLGLEEQQQVLDFLTNDKKWIKYTHEYLSNRKVETIVDRLKPDLVRLIPFAKQSAEPFTYTIEVLDSFGTRNKSASKKKPDTKNIANTQSQIYEVSLRLNSKILNLYIGGALSVPIKRFKTKKSNIYKAYSALQSNKGKALTTADMGIGKASSEVDDIVKSMKLEKVFALANFVDVDMRKQTLRIPYKTQITAENLAILQSLSIEKDR